MSIHYIWSNMNQRELALHILYKTIKDSSYSNLLMRNELNKLPEIQRGFVTNLVNGTIRKYEYLYSQFKNEIKANTDLRLILILCMALYERFYLNEKDYVVNNEYVSLCKNKHDKGFINALLHKINELKKSDNDADNCFLPEWIYRLLKSQYNEEDFKSIIDVYQSIPNTYYRLNKNKCSFDDLKSLNFEIINDDIFTSKNNLINSEEFDKGYFYIQDYNSASLYRHLDLNKDDILLDVCSAPGSKLFNCLDIVKPNNAYANDLHEHRVELIKKMASKLGYEGIHYLVSDANELKDKLDIRFNKILLDAPCSGLGVISRKPDIKFHIKPESLDEIEKIQLDLLNNIDPLLDIDGILLYATCTLNKKENSKQINKFLMNNDRYVLEDESTIINSLGDCFYYAKLRKVKL